MTICKYEQWDKNVSTFPFYRSDEYDIVGTGLIKTSVVRLGHLGTFQESTIIKKIGIFPEDKRVELQGILLKILDIDINQFK